MERVKAPCLNIHSKYDYLTDSKSISFIKENISSNIVKNIILNPKGVHNLFFSKSKDKMFHIIINFFKKNNIFKK